jgi:hypothetical protein
MATSFDPSTKIISLSSGTTSIDVRGVYSDWKRWVAVSDNAKYLPVFSATGGDTIDAGAGTSIPCYAFLLNGWRIRPQEASHTLSVSGGVLLVSGGGDPFVNTTGAFIVRINYSQPVQAITVSTAGGGGASAADVAAAVLSAAVTTPIHSNIKQMNDTTLTGAGVVGNEWGAG